MRLRGVFIKLGQVLSVLGSFLPAAYGRRLEKLQDKVPPREFAEMLPRLEEAFGQNPLERFDSFETEALAAASLAQVYRATAPDGRLLAVKILYPGIAELIDRDLGVVRKLLPVLEKLFGFIHTGRVLEQLSDMLAHETDYANERRNMGLLRALFEDRDDVVVPDVVDELTAGGVLTMGYQQGHKISDSTALRNDDIDPEAVALLLVDCFITMLLRKRVFHADPHPGNFLVRPGPTLVILDYGAVESVSETLAEGMRMVVLGAMMRNDEQILLGVEHMGFVAEGGDREMLADIGRAYLKVLGGVRIEDFSKMDRETMMKLSGFEQTRGKLREIMRNAYYPDGFFYVERTLILLFGLVGSLVPKGGLPKLIGSFATSGLFGDLAAFMAPKPTPGPSSQPDQQDT